MPSPNPDWETASVKSAEGKLPILKTVSDFSLTNQFGQEISLSDLRGKIWVADIIFTRCPGPCARMTKQLRQFQSLIPKDDSVKIVSLTADPEFDTPEVFKKYAERFETDPKRWFFLTGPKKKIYDLAMNSLLLAVQEKTPDEQTAENDLFIHSTIFVLVDRNGDVRSYYESTEPGTNERILTDIKKLLAEK
jgi:protein SCO1/2